MERREFNQECALSSGLHCSLGGDSIVVLNEGDLAPPGAKVYRLETPLQTAAIAKEIAWHAVFRPLTCHAAPGWEEMKRQVEECHRAAHLLISEVSDFGKEAFVHALHNWEHHGPFCDFIALRGCCSNLPAIICGGGPSLAELKQPQGLIFAAGTAHRLLEQIGISPHYVCAFDKQGWVPKERCSIPLFMQSRLNPDTVAQFSGEKILVPESGPLPWEQWWLDGREAPFPCGWTAGNFAMQVTAWLGCNPIILVGMDFCYSEGSKYALEGPHEQNALIEVQNRKGRMVKTQRDWVMAAHFCDEIARSHPEQRWISSSLDGLFLGEAIEVKPLSELTFPKVDAVKLPTVPLELKIQEKKKIWAENYGEDFEPIYEGFLAPLWQIWKPLFMREAEGQNPELHRSLFFQRVLEELSGT